MASNGSCFLVTWIIFIKPPLGGRPNTKPGDHGTPNTHNRWFILFHHVWEPTWIDIPCNSIWLRARSHMTSHHTCESVTTLQDLGGVLGRPLDTFIWALTISWSQLLACMWSGCKKPKVVKMHGSQTTALEGMQTMDRETWPLVTYELVEFERKPAKVRDFRKIINRFREIREYNSN